MKKNKTKTQKIYSRWKTAKALLHGGTYLCPFIPAGILTAIRADEWFAKKSWSIGVGLASLLITLLITLLGILNKDKLIKSKISPLFPFAAMLGCFGASFMFLANISGELGMMFILVCVGCLTSAGASQIEKTVVDKKVKWYDAILKEAGLDSKENLLKKKKAEAIANARKEAEDIGVLLE